MPGFDRTGPLGQGPMTGGGFGYCGAARRPGYGRGGGAFYGRFSRGPRLGRGRRFAWGAGPTAGYRQPSVPDPKGELAELRREAGDLKVYLKDVEARIAEIEKASD